jgi:hypothetical protein
MPCGVGLISSIRQLIGKALDKKGLLHNWISEGYHAKRFYDVTTASVTISTIHSVKDSTMTASSCWVWTG